MFSRVFFSVRSFSLSSILACALLASGAFFLPVQPVRADTCHCHCSAVRLDADRTGSCSTCHNTCVSYCGPEGLPASETCTADTPTASTPRPSSGSSSGSSGSGTSRRRTTTNTTTDTPAGETGASGVCTFNCVTPRLTACTTDNDCRSLCDTQCPTLVAGGARCASNPAPRCVTAVDGTKNCAFECVVTPPDACQIGDAGNAQCGSRGLAVCAPPAGAGASAPTINVSTVVQPRCVDASRASSGGAGGTDAGRATGENAGTDGAADGDGGESGSGSGSSRNRSGSSGTQSTYRLTNPIRGANTIPAVIGKAVRTVMGLVGAIALLMFVLGGVRWILSAGDPKAVQAASDMLKNATIGLLIIFLSYTIITVGMGLVNDLSNQGEPTGGSQTTNTNSSGNTTNATNRTPTAPAPGTVAACNAAYPPSPYMRGDCTGCQASCMNVLCRTNATDAALDPVPPPADPRNRNTSYVFPAGVSAATTECLSRCRTSADCPAAR